MKLGCRRKCYYRFIVKAVAVVAGFSKENTIRDCETLIFARVCLQLYYLSCRWWSRWRGSARARRTSSPAARAWRRTWSWGPVWGQPPSPAAGVSRSHLTVSPSTVSWKWLYSPNAPYQGLLTVADNFGPSLVSSLWISKLFVGQYNQN